MIRSFKKKSASSAKTVQSQQLDKEEAQIETLKTRKEKKEGVRRVVITIFAVFIAISMMVPSIAQIIMGRDAINATEKAVTSIEDIDKMFTKDVEEAEKNANDNPKDASAQVALGDKYLSWANTAMIFGGKNVTAEHIKELEAKSEAAFDKAIQLGAGTEAYVGKAQVLQMSSKPQEAIDLLNERKSAKDLTSEYWTCLGQLYQTEGKKEEAIAAYTEAEKLDPEDKSGDKSFATAQIKQLKGENTDSKGGK